MSKAYFCCKGILTHRKSTTIIRNNTGVMVLIQPDSTISLKKDGTSVMPYTKKKIVIGLVAV